MLTITYVYSFVTSLPSAEVKDNRNKVYATGKNSGVVENCVEASGSFESARANLMPASNV